MTTKDKNYVTMCRTVNDVFTKYAGEWASAKRFASEVTHFRGILNEVGTTKADSQIVTSGATADKADAALNLFDKAVNLGKRASVYALDNNNQELHDHLRTSRGALLQIHDTFALAKCKDIYNRLIAVKTGLTDYGIAETDLTELKQLIDAYDALVNRPRGLIVERKGHNESIPEQIKALRESIYKLDSLINLFAGTVFETDYKNARIIVDTGRRKRKTAEASSEAVSE